jgi:hypothetical protein
MENYAPLFSVLTGIAVMLQAGVLLALYITLRKTATKMEALAEEVRTKALPTIETIQTTVTALHPKLIVIADNVTEATSVVRNQVQRVDATVTDITDRARLQVIRADELLGRTLDRVEQTSELVTRTVVSPVRQVSGVIRGVSAGVEFLLGQRARKNGDAPAPRRPVQQDEMFI